MGGTLFLRSAFCFRGDVDARSEPFAMVEVANPRRSELPRHTHALHCLLLLLWLPICLFVCFCYSLSETVAANLVEEGGGESGGRGVTHSCGIGMLAKYTSLFVVVSPFSFVYSPPPLPLCSITCFIFWGGLLRRRAFESLVLSGAAVSLFFMYSLYGRQPESATPNGALSFVGSRRPPP